MGSESRMGKTVKVAEGVFVMKTLVGIGEGEGHLTHDGLRQRFLLNLQDGREGEILQEDSLTTSDMVDEEADYIDNVKDNTVSSFDIDTTTSVIRLQDGSLVLHSPAQASSQLPSY